MDYKQATVSINGSIPIDGKLIYKSNLAPHSPFLGFIYGWYDIFISSLLGITLSCHYSEYHGLRRGRWEVQLARRNYSHLFVQLQFSASDNILNFLHKVSTL